jgi:hypothetical protein
MPFRMIYDSEILSILLFAVVKLDRLIRPDPEIEPHRKHPKPPQELFVDEGSQTLAASERPNTQHPGQDIPEPARTENSRHSSRAENWI